MKLVIVESPTKCHTIGKYLGEDYKVIASLGHVRDLSIRGKSGLGIDIDNGFKPSYEIQSKQMPVVKDLKKNAKEAEEVIIATDPDREGEAIAWHLMEILGLDVKTTKRLEFHEITRPSIAEALNNPRTLDMNLVASQETRRILDRIIGFKLSSLLQSKIKSRSAGRVQSSSLKLLVDQEKEIAKFKPEEYWTIDVTLASGKTKLKVVVDKEKISSEKEALEIEKSLAKTATVLSIDKKRRSVESKPAFTTSTMQQEAFNRYKFSTKKTSLVAQKLYEGVQVGQETVGLITYMRTDSTRLSPVFEERAKRYIVENFGDDYVGKVKTKKSKTVIQDAHEAIRPTSLTRSPDAIKQYLSNDEYKLYSLIYNRALASLMSAKIDEVTTVKFRSNDVILKTSGTVNIFNGHSVLFNSSDEDEKSLPIIKEEDIFDVKKVTKEQHFTKAPARFSEAKLVKTMEEVGIGRPSTYASTIEILKARKYVNVESGTLIPTDQGIKTDELLEEYFTNLVNPSFTAQMEKNLDEIVAGSESRLELLQTFYDSFIKQLDFAKNNIEKVKDEPSGNICPKCGSPLVYKNSKYGKFEACSNYPHCHYVVPKAKEEIPSDAPICPDCGSPLVLRKNKKGQSFYGCSNFPKCTFVMNDESNAKETKIEIVGKCPDCGGDLIVKRGKFSKFIGCSNYPNCHHMEKYSKSKRTK
ncbi:MAG: type I DNA topoisomerase [Erysipelotrichales bacterium]|nr:type I DNA topoisomerase [Erysipelotrichales bacterium]